MSHISALFRLFHPFARDDRGNVAMMFAVAAVPLLGFAGAAIDYTRANSARTAMQAALDSTALMLSKDAATLSNDQLNAKAKSYFDAMYKHPEAQGVTVNATYAASSGGGQTVELTAAGTMSTDFMNILGMPQISFGTRSTATWGTGRLRVALALDTTGSMAQDGKMDALKPAAKKLLTDLQALAKNSEDVYVSIVPFSKDVNVGTSLYSATWIKWDDTPSDPWSGTSGTRAPWDDYNGTCSDPGSSWNPNNTRARCAADGGNWTVKNHSTWNGCVTDRNQSYDVSNTIPTAGTPNSMVWAEQYGSCPASMMELSNNWTMLKNKIDALYPAGNTNQPIGLAWAWQTLSPGPFTYPAEGPGYKYQKVIVLMSDGLNTENRWSTNVSTINARQATMCNNIKAQGIIVHAIQVNTDNDPTQAVMRDCAVATGGIFREIKTASQLAGVFDEVLTQLSKLRIAK